MPNQSLRPFIYRQRDLSDPIELNANHMPEFSPLSGSELPYEPMKWNGNKSVKQTHNCYQYAIGKIKPSLENKPQPGYGAQYPAVSNTENYTCKEFLKRLKKDNPGLYTVKFGKPCKRGYHKAFMAIAPDPINYDYHFWRQDANGYWSHKPGRTDVTNVDASGKHIRNPLLADRKYPVFDYKKPCFFFCVNPNLSISASRSLSGGAKHKARHKSRSKSRSKGAMKGWKSFV